MNILIGSLIPRSFTDKGKNFIGFLELHREEFGFSIPWSFIERGLGCILSETARKPNYRFSSRPIPKSWLSVEKGSWYDDHDKFIHCVLISIDVQPFLLSLLLPLAVSSVSWFDAIFYISVLRLYLYPCLSFESIFHLHQFSPPLTLRWWHIAYEVQNEAGLININIVITAHQSTAVLSLSPASSSSSLSWWIYGWK